MLSKGRRLLLLQPVGSRLLRILILPRPYGWPLLVLLCVLLLAACGDHSTPEPTATPAPTASVTATTVPTAQVVQLPRAQPTSGEVGVLADRATPANIPQNLPALAAYQAQVAKSLQQPIPILPLTENLDKAQQLAQEIAMRDANFQAALHEPNTNKPLRNEIFGVYPLRESDITEATAACRQVTCYRVEMYNYALNLSTIAMVDITNARIVAVNQLMDMQPDIPPALTKVAEEIAVNAPEVIKALGIKPDEAAAMMANTKTALNRSRCERSGHLCVAPTFIKGERALWAIVDLTDGVLVGVRWTEVGQAPKPTITEKSLENEVVTKRYCETSTELTRGQWQLSYILTSSDGLRVYDVKFRGQPVLDSVKLVDWHVSYSQKDGFGYSDAIGCPVFSQAAVVAFNGPSLAPIQASAAVTGFVIAQSYKSEQWPAPCNYYYEQRFEFYNDGRFRIVFANEGRGCGNDGTYRPVVRIALAGNQTFAAWKNKQWQPWATEQWQAPSDEVTPEGYQFRVTQADGTGYFIEPGRGQFGDGGRGDNPFVYVTRHHTGPGENDEGDADLITIGACCNTDYHQGPEKFIEPAPEPITNAPLVLWYVAQLKNDDQPGHQYCWADAVLENGVYVPKAYPCNAGPMFVPVKKP